MSEVRNRLFQLANKLQGDFFKRSIDKSDVKEEKRNIVLNKEKELQRKNFRNKLINNNRFIAESVQSSPAVNNKNDINVKPEPGKNQASVVETKKPELNKQTSDSNQTDGTMNSTYLIVNNQNLSNRRKLLEIWRKEKHDTFMRDKLAQRPVFKVPHLDVKDYELSKMNQNLISSNNSMAQSKLYPKHHSTMNSTHSEISRPITRSLTKKASSTSDLKLKTPSNVFHFGNTSSSSTKFTFSASINTNGMAKGTSSGLKSYQMPTKSAISRSNTCLSKPPVSQSITKSRKPSEEAKKVITPALPILSKKPLQSTKNSNETVMDIKYEEFCNNFCAKDEKECGVQLEVKTKKCEFVFNDNVNPDVNENVLKSENETKEQLKKRMSYRKSKSGYYKIDMQSSILELDSNVDENKFLNIQKFKEPPKMAAFENFIKLETQIEQNDEKVEIVINKLDNILTFDSADGNKKIEQVNEEVIITETHKNQISDNIDETADKDTNYYRSLVVEQTKFLNNLSEKWLSKCEDKEKVSEDEEGDIRSACGLAKLLIDERFAQFTELIDQCEASNSADNNGEIKLVKCSDLQGFWDMVDYQIKDVEKKFLSIENSKNVSNVPVVKKKVIKPSLKNMKSVGSTDENKEETGENKKPETKSVKSKFAEFRAKLKQGNKKPENDLHINVVEECFGAKTEVKIVEENPKCEDLEIKIEVEKPMPKDEITEKPAEPLRKYNLRSRPSDLIKFDSPIVETKPRKIGLSCVAESPNKVISDNSKNSSIKIVLTDENKENLDDIDFLDFDREPIMWRSKPESDANSNSMNELKSRNLLNLTPKTPRRVSTISGNLFSSSKNQVKNIAHSPLLKLVYISSHGKRTSFGPVLNNFTNLPN